MKKNRFIAIADILGFKNLIGNSTLEDIVNRVLQLDDEIKTPTYPFIRNIKSIEEADKYFFRKGDRNFEEIQDLEHTTKYTLFSDTILIYNEGKKRENVVGFFMDVIQMIKDSISLEIPLRIGIAYGESYIDEARNIFAGKAIRRIIRLASHLRYSCLFR